MAPAALAPGRHLRLTRRLAFWLAAALTLGMPAGCTVLDVDVPITLAELATQQTEDPNAFTTDTIVLHNLRRVLDNDLSAEARIASMAVLVRLDGDNSAHDGPLAMVLADETSPPRVRMAVLQLLVRKDYPSLATHVVRALPTTRDERMRRALLDWLTRHPRPEVLAEVVRLWAAADPTDEVAENRYRRVAETTARQTWSGALLSALNKPSFLARGSALELLARRLPKAELNRRLLAFRPRTPAVLALQYYIRRMDYIPQARDQLLPAVLVFRTKKLALADAAKLAATWSATTGYRFHIRDFHLLSQLHRDPMRRLPGRVALLDDLIGQLRRQQPADQAVSPTLPDLRTRLTSLSMADLVRLHLLNEMLNRRRVQAALRVMAERDREDQTTQWGGLVFYDNGRANARLYPPGGHRGDHIYLPGEPMAYDAADSLAHFHAHFAKDHPHGPPGPTDDELHHLRSLNTRGLLLTSLSDRRFNAIYYGDDRTLINLGDFPFGE